MSTIKVQNIRDFSGQAGLTMNGNNTVSVAGNRLIVDNLTINGNVSGSGEGANHFLPSHGGHAGKILNTNGTTPFWSSPGSAGNITSMQVFTSGGTWNKPSGVRYIKVQVVGGGGGGSGHGESGGAGGYSEEVIDVTSVSSVSVSVSGESNGTYYRGGGGNGGSSSFGGYLSASGGYGANRNNQHSGGLPGTGSGGNLNIYGGGGQAHHQESSVGGSSYFGGAVAAGHPQGGHFAHNHQSHSAPGSGGTGGYFNGHRGSNGRPGMVVITHYL
tara:strand:+ start:1502 stop:2317 length:816 start_codon:yes stop_codon:yes gene_type:complete